MHAKFQHTDVFEKGCGYINGVQIDPRWFLYNSPQIYTKPGKQQNTFIEACQRMNLLIIQLDRIHRFTVKNWNYGFVCLFLDLLLVCFSEYKHEKPILSSQGFENRRE